MESYECLGYSAGSSPASDLVIEDLDEFAAGFSGTCYCTTTADYVVNTSVTAAIGRG